MKAAAAVGGLFVVAALALPPLGPELRFRWNLWALRHRPDALFERAELHYAAKDVGKARAFAEAARARQPRHAGAVALLLELDFVEGRVVVPGEPITAVRPICIGYGSLIEIDVLYDRARQAYDRGDRAAAEAGFRTLVEKAKWLPTGVELESRRKSAQDMLDRIAAEK